MATFTSLDAQAKSYLSLNHFRAVRYLCLVGAFVVMITAYVLAEVERENYTSERLFWPTANDEDDVLIDSSEYGDDASAGADGGFSSLDGMLQWAIGHSDPTKLKETAQDVQRMSPNELKNRQQEIKELMEKMKTPSDAMLMQIAIKDLNNDSISLEDRHRALQELLTLVEPIDNSNDLNKLGGLAALLRELDHSDPEIRAVAAWVIGKASQNNALVQKQALDQGALPKLMAMVESISVEESIKALYAISSLIRNNIDGQQSFYAQSGVKLLQDILSNASTDKRLCKKAVFLLTDLAENHSEHHEGFEFPFLRNQSFLRAVVALIVSPDLDLQEKTLAATKSLLLVKTADVSALNEMCTLNEALQTAKEHLKSLMLVDARKDYAADVEALRREVEAVFIEKLGSWCSSAS